MAAGVGQRPSSSELNCVHKRQNLVRDKGGFACALVANSNAYEAVLVVDDNALVRSMVRQIFESEPDFEVSGEAENGRDAIEKAENLRPNIIILDLCYACHDWDRSSTAA